MKLTPLDLRKQQFKKTLRGYDPDEVRGFIEKLAQDWEEVLEEKRRADERVALADEKLRHYEKVELALQEALEAARETGRRAEDTAHQRARLIVEEAELRAQRIIQDAEQERYNVRQDLVKLTSRQNEISARLRAFLMSEMEVLAQFQGDDPIGFIKLVAATDGSSQEPLAGPRAQLGPAAAPSPDGPGADAVDAGAPEPPRREMDAAAAPVADPEAPSVLAPEAPPTPMVEDRVEQAEAPVSPVVAPQTPVTEAPAAASSAGSTPVPPLEPVTPEPISGEGAPAPPDTGAEPEEELETAEEAPSAFTYRDWLSGLATRRADAPRQEERVEEQAEERARGPLPFGRSFFKPPAAEPPPEPAPSSDAARGWSLRSLVTGDREESQPSVVASEDERERIRRILEDLD